MRYFGVDGKAIRKEKENIDWVEGGNPARYPKLQPAYEIWIEAVYEKDEGGFIALHETKEFVEMKYRRYSYEEAHEMASEEEAKYRASEDQVGAWERCEEILIEEGLA